MIEKKQVVNPYLPLNEYIPDGEPCVFDGRVYIYGSHDFAGGEKYCMGDYVTWSTVSIRVDIPDGVHGLFFLYTGKNAIDFKEFTLKS